MLLLQARRTRHILNDGGIPEDDEATSLACCHDVNGLRIPCKPRAMECICAHDKHDNIPFSTLEGVHRRGGVYGGQGDILRSDDGSKPHPRSDRDGAPHLTHLEGVFPSGLDQLVPDGQYIY